MTKKSFILLMTATMVTVIISNFIASCLFSRYEGLIMVCNAFQHNIKKCEDMHLLIDTVIINIKKDPSETITKLEILRNNTPITYEGMNVKEELINCGLIQEQEETLK